MILRLFPLLLLLAVAVLPSGCASTEETSDDQMESYHSTPDKPEDDHGWGANLQGLGSQH
jgi:uncharacterized protein YceK